MWSRRSIEILIGVALLGAAAACSVTPRRSAEGARTAAAVAHPTAAQPGAAGKAQGGQEAPAAGPPPVSPQASEEFDRALALARGGNDRAAEAQFSALAQQYPQFCTPLVDLGILYRKDGNVDAATRALEQSAARSPGSALAWTELGITQRLGGKFQDAERSYTRAIKADPAYAPAYRDRGVLRDLYLGQPAAALSDFERYRKLTGEEKPVAMWIAELQHRTGIRDSPGGEVPKAAGAGTGVQAPAPASAVAPPRHQARN